MTKPLNIKMENNGASSPAPPERAPGGRRRDPSIQRYIEEFAKYEVGQSFFVEGVQARQLEFLRRAFKTAGLDCTIRTVQTDEIYHVAGTRVWRTEEEL